MSKQPLQAHESEALSSCPDCERSFKTTAALYRHLLKAHKADVGEAELKYRNKKVELDGIIFGSGAEARRYSVLLLLQRAGEITDLAVHPKFPILVAGTLVGSYTADFRYRKGGEVVVEDVKSPATKRNPLFRFKSKVFTALYNLKVKEV